MADCRRTRGAASTFSSLPSDAQGNRALRSSAVHHTGIAHVLKTTAEISCVCPCTSWLYCRRFEAHQRLGLPTIKCRVRKANQQVLKMHMM
jgi:uncharacterized ParB-like nuclease family protein